MEPAPQQPEQFVITGEKVALGLLRRELLPLCLKWHNDFEVTRTDGCEQRLTTWEEQEAWYERICKDDRRTHFVIYERATSRPIGTTNLRDIDHCMRTAEFGVTIGEKDCWGRGYGTEATLLTLDYGFSALGLHNIWLDVLSYNERGIRAYKRVGFREIGRRREAHRLGGQAYDVLWMDCLATEFRSPVLHGLLTVSSEHG